MVIDKLNMEIEIYFTEWVAQNHYRLCNVQEKICYWENEDGIKTTKELWELYTLPLSE